MVVVAVALVMAVIEWTALYRAEQARWVFWFRGFSISRSEACGREIVAEGGSVKFRTRIELPRVCYGFH